MACRSHCCSMPSAVLRMPVPDESRISAAVPSLTEALQSPTPLVRVNSALALGSLMGVLRTVPGKWLSGIAATYVEVFRNIPLLVQLFLWQLAILKWRLSFEN